MRTRVSPIPTSSVRDGRGASAEITAASRVGTERAGVEPKISEYLAISRTHGEKGAIWEFSLVDPKGKTNPGPAFRSTVPWSARGPRSAPRSCVKFSPSCLVSVTESEGLGLTQPEASQASLPPKLPKI